MFATARDGYDPSLFFVVLPFVSTLTTAVFQTFASLRFACRCFLLCRRYFFMVGCEDNYIYFQRYPRQYGHMRPYFESRRDHEGRTTACSTAGAKNGGEDIVEFTQTMSSPLFCLSLFAIHAVSFAEVPKEKTGVAKSIRRDFLLLNTRFLKETKHLVKSHKQGRPGLFSIELFLTIVCQKKLLWEKFSGVAMHFFKFLSFTLFENS